MEMAGVRRENVGSHVGQAARRAGLEEARSGNGDGEMEPGRLWRAGDGPNIGALCEVRLPCEEALWLQTSQGQVRADLMLQHALPCVGLRLE